MLSGSVVGGLEAKGKGKDRDEETKAAAAQCLLTLLRSRGDDDGSFTPTQAQKRLQIFKDHSNTPKFIPILGQTLNSVLETAESRNLSLQKLSLDLAFTIIHVYLPDSLVVTVLPGVASTMCKLALGTARGKGWAKGDIVAQSLLVMQEAIVIAIGDDVCIRDGALVAVNDLEDLTKLVSEKQPQKQSDGRPFGTTRTPSWLRATSSQLHMAIKTLSPLVKHPTSSALVALANFSKVVLGATPRTLEQTQSLLLSFLLSLYNSDLESVSSATSQSLFSLFSTGSEVQYSLLHTLLRSTRDNLVALPILLPSHADAKVEHIAGVIDSVCRLAITGEEVGHSGLRSISSEIGKLLGPSGGIEKWGWGLLSVLEFVDPIVTVTRTSTAQLMLENDSSAGSEWVPFPQATLSNISNTSTYDALVKMFRSLGRAAGDVALFSVEWFASVGQSGKHSRAVAGLWCACRLLEGVANIDLTSEASLQVQILPTTKRLEKFARGLAKSLAQLWDSVDDDLSGEPEKRGDDEEHTSANLVQYITGVVPLHETLQITNSTPPPQKQRKVSQSMLHKAFTLQLLSVTAGILQSRFVHLLIYTLYPILHSLISPISFLSTTGLAALNYVTHCTSYASPGNLLLSNFDYVLDSISRRLTRRWLDIDATKVLVVMIHLVGNDIVERAGDVVEECFDRLDEYHGYDAIVEGIVEVLHEVIKVIEAEGEAMRVDDEGHKPLLKPWQADKEKLEEFFVWFPERNKPLFEEDNTNYGPAPRKAWGEGEDKGKGKDAGNDEDVEMSGAQADHDEKPPPTPAQALTKQIVTRSMYFLTHRSAVIRARILTLLSASVPVLPEDVLMPAIHSAWPFILNRLTDTETFVVSTAAYLVETLTIHRGSYMYRRIWDDVWPRFYGMLLKLQEADGLNALSRRGPGAVGTESTYTHSHRLYRSLLRTMTAAVKGVDPQDSSNWQVIISFRRFLHSKASEELQQCARDLYIAAALKNADAVWLALYSTFGQVDGSTRFLYQPTWDIVGNVELIFKELED
uniref:Putative ARM heat repeat protein n=1 Tax=Moniliophthora roreri TaxID=221103 RepID=A0A0W0FAX1_MONRR